MKYAIKLSVFLGIVALISTVALAAVNSVTAPIIEEYQNARFTEAVEGAFPESTGFTRIANDQDLNHNYLMEVLEIFGDDGTIGFIYSKVVPGFGGPITYVMGLSSEGDFVSFDVLSHSETPGFGARVVDEPDWSNRLLSKNIDDQVDILTGASNTTRALIGGIAAMREDFNSYRRIG